MTIYHDTSDNLPTFTHVALGGSFDHLHAGHRRLLSAAARVTAPAGKVVIGVSGCELLKNKTHKELISPYEDRLAAVDAYIRPLLPAGAELVTFCLDSGLGYMDTPALQCLVVSEETASAIAVIDEYRTRLQLQPIDYVVIGLEMGEGGNKISSTDIRASINN